MDKIRAWLSNSVGSSQHDNYAFKDRNISSFLHWGSNFEYKLCTSYIRNVGDLFPIHPGYNWQFHTSEDFVIFYIFNSNIFGINDTSSLK